MIETGVRLKNVAVVLCRPGLAENVGTAARAAGNMGLGRLILVQPPSLDEEVLRGTAARAGEGLVEGLTVYDDLAAALAGFHYAVGTTARTGSRRGPLFSPRELAPKLVGLSREHRVALVFGPERTGLSTAELRLCQAVVRIPTASQEVSSLNLAQAVLILGYELLLARAGEPSGTQVRLATAAERQDMYDHLARTLLEIGFFPDENTEHWLMSFKRLFNRTGLSPGECNLIRGMCRQIEWAVRTGGEPQG